MISKILVAIDGSESSLRAYEYASFLAYQIDADMIIVVHLKRTFLHSNRIMNHGIF